MFEWLYRRMKTTQLMVGLFSLGTATALHADTFRLTDGTTVEGELDAPTEVTLKTATGERRVAFSLLPAEIQQRYWRKSAEVAAVAAVGTAPMAPVVDTDLANLAAEVSLDTWSQVAGITSFRDKPERRGTGGLVVTKAFNALEENWATVYGTKSPVGTAGAWEGQLTRARAMQERTTQFVQRRWLELFIKAGEAVARRDSNEFATLIREMSRSPLAGVAIVAPESGRNFFTAK